MKNILLIAPPLAGKGTQSKLISDYFDIPAFSVGEALREKNILEINSGKLYNDDVIKSIVIDSLEKLRTKKGIVIDGYPRNNEQLTDLIEISALLKFDITHVIYLDLDRNESLRRINGRRVCPNCNALYNVIFEDLKPQRDNICDYCNHELIKREDDNEEILKVRLDVFDKNTEMILDYFNQEKILTYVDASLDAEGVFESIKKVLK